MKIYSTNWKVNLHAVEMYKAFECLGMTGHVLGRAFLNGTEKGIRVLFYKSSLDGFKGWIIPEGRRTFM